MATILESKFEHVADNIDADEVPHYEFDLKISIVLKTALKKIPGKKFLTNTFSTLQGAAKKGEVLEIFDVNNHQIKPDLSGIEADAIEKNFCVEVTEKEVQVFSFGAKIQSTMPFSTLKERTKGLLKSKSTYISLHRSGFTHGINWVSLGFFTSKHPRFVNQESIRQTIVEKFVDGWKSDNIFWTSQRKKEVIGKLNTKATPFDPSEFPFFVTSKTTTAKESTTTITSYTVSVMVPQTFAKAGRSIMDYLLLNAKVLPNYVPLAFQYEDQKAFCNILKAHDKWMEEHRNIQITNIPNAAYWNDPASKDGQTLRAILSSTPTVLDFNYDPKHSRLNVSANNKNFATTAYDLSQKITTANFSVRPKVRSVQNFSANNSQASTATAATKYSEILSTMISSATSQASSHKVPTVTNRRNAWHKTVPTTIDFYDNNAANFPPLRPTSPTVDNQSYDTASDGITASTIQSAIQDALAEVQRKHNNEIQSMREAISMLQEQITQRNQSTTDRLEKKIDLLMQQFCLGPTTINNIGPTKFNETVNDDIVPSPFRKKPRNEHPESATPTSTSLQQDDPGWDFDDDEDISSSQDGADAPSGSET